MISVHCGAGKHSDRHRLKYKRLCDRACRAGMEILKNGGDALDAIRAAIVVLENDPLSNAGYGSNLTTSGQVECDAAVMDGGTLLYGGCGAVKRVKNPIGLAYDICKRQLDKLPLGLVPPSLLVGAGALEHARKSHLTIVKNKDLVSTKAAKQFEKYRRLLEMEESVDMKKLDTVGAVCCDFQGGIASGCSSGGLLLKTPGRVGQGALYGSGVWAESFTPGDPSIAVCTTGCGEHLVQTQLAKTISDDLRTCSCPTVGLSKCMTDKFINSRYLHRIAVKNSGALVLFVPKNGEGSVLWGHSTETMSIGYMRRTDEKPKSFISKLPNDVSVGTTVTVGGCSFNFTT